jgi:phosphomannomutase
MVSVAGVRGIVGDSLTSEVALAWAQAFGTTCAPGIVIVGGDSRISKTMMRAATIAGLAASGCRIIDLGVVPTPTIQLAVEHHRARGGIAITASHNPLEWNALKFFGHDALFLDETAGDAVRKIAESGRLETVSAEQIGSYERDDNAVERHIEAVRAVPFLKLADIARRKFRVGVDAVNGAGGELLTKLLDRLHCDVISFHTEPTGYFPRDPEPTVANLAPVCAQMKAANVDIAFVVDPDADRLAIILENGIAPGEEYTLAAACDSVLRYQKGPVVVNCSTSKAVHDIAAKYGCPITESRVGEAHVSRMMIQQKAVIGGEGNGGVIYPPVHIARDSAVGVVLILQAILEHGGRASDYFATLPGYQMVKMKREFSDLNLLNHAMQRVDLSAPFGEPSRLDGLKWNVDHGWVQIRSSNTEPIVRVFAEARERGQAEALANTVLNLLHETN